MAVEIPSWLTKEYMENALGHGENYSVKISEFKVDMAVPKGTNFVCNVYRVSVEFRRSDDDATTNSKSFIIKEPIYGPMYDSFLKVAIQTEIKVYNVLAPKLNLIFDNSGDMNCLLPKSYVSSEKNVIIMDDLKPQGYLLGDLINRYDFEHALLALKALAKFHAGCKVVIDQEPDLIEDFTLLLNRDDMKEKLRPLYMSNFKNLADECKNHPEMEKYSSWLYENYETGLDKGIKLMDPVDNEFNVLIHGDFGVQNLLVKYNDKTPINIVPIDFQGCRYASPVVDFYNFVEFNIQEDIRHHRFDELVEFYVNELNTNLERFGSTSKLEESEFKKYLHDRLYLRVFYSVAFLAVAIGMRNESESFSLDDFSSEKLSTETNPFQRYVKNKKFIKAITKRFKEFEQMGVIVIKD